MCFLNGRHHFILSLPRDVRSQLFASLTHMELLTTTFLSNNNHQTTMFLCLKKHMLENSGNSTAFE